MYNVYYNELASYIYSLNNNKFEAEDIVQNVMLTIWKKRQSLKIKTSIRSYLYRACYHEFVTEYNAHKKDLKYIDAVEEERLTFFVEEDFESIKSQKRKIKLAIEKLPPKCKEIFVLNKQNGFKYQEIAEILSISIKTVEGQISKAILKIKEEIKSLEDDV
ncbi:RNA polymerase sigma factor [Wenyingzhuangia sp. 2_MG-2023]|uniref:RNA polymerase sigma factor n=1 Tax=Wenyingzhuangia sp. 2_MG-2023 TaxID=3062639 RepID=UPI0026E334D8|nr:sigma-70 family RNA polymerase sigma factor [Wenyingzhuangia sp. 2_MG-2023]MDO6736410.1 sigma-70 family RNA polymerase sigma factor [Wenyingzhuangia sp. 2_MG-2023]